VHSQKPSLVWCFHCSLLSVLFRFKTLPGTAAKLRVPFQRVSTPASAAAAIAVIVKQVAAGECTRAPELQGLQKAPEEQ
jgi:hypothetical protein